MKEIYLVKDLEKNDFIINGMHYGYDCDDKTVIVKNMPRTMFGKSQDEKTYGKVCSISLGEKYVVKPNDTLDSISKTFNISKENIMQKNNMTRDIVFPGQMIEL